MFGHLLSLSLYDFTMPMVRVAFVGFFEQPEALRSTYVDPPYHPPRHVSFSFKSRTSFLYNLKERS